MMDELFEELSEAPEPTNSENLHLALQGFCFVLPCSVTDPVSVSSGIKVYPYEKMFYDCTEDAQVGLEIMQKRLANHSDTIRTFIQQHEQMRGELEGIEEAVNTKSTDGAKEHIKEFLGIYRTQMEMITKFRDQNKEDPFLSYPYGQTYGRSNRIIRPIVFNRTQNWEGAWKEALVLESTIEMFQPYEEIKFGSLNQTGMRFSGIEANWMDTSYPSRIGCVKQMLADLGFK